MLLTKTVAFTIVLLTFMSQAGETDAVGRMRHGVMFHLQNIVSLILTTVLLPLVHVQKLEIPSMAIRVKKSGKAWIVCLSTC